MRDWDDIRHEVLWGASASLDDFVRRLTGAWRNLYFQETSAHLEDLVTVDPGNGFHYDLPFRYMRGGWPHGQVRELDDEEGGEFVRYQLEQLRASVVELVEHRRRRGVSQAHLARLTGLRANTISDLESGKSYPDWHTLSRLA